MQPLSSGSPLEMRSSPFPPPPSSPTLTDFPLSQGEESPAGVGSGAIVKAGQALDEMLASLARSSPQAAEKLDRIKTALKGVIAEIVVAQRQEPNGQPEEAGEGSSLPPSPGTYGTPR